MPVRISALIGMRLRHISPPKIVDSYIRARKAGLELTTDELENHYLAGGNVERVVSALISAHQAGINLAFKTSCAIDLVLFALFCRLLRGRDLPLHYVAVSTVLARILSAAYNFTVNYKVVFRSRQSAAGSAAKYVLLALVQMSLSALLVTGGTLILPAVPEVGVKAAVDTVLFLISYYVQRRFIF